MKKAFVLLTLIAATATFASAQQKALPGKYAGSNTVTIFDSTGVYMEESGLSHVLTHKCIEMYSFAGCAAYSTYKIDYDPLSAYCDIERVLVHRQATGKTDTLLWPGRDGNITVYDYVAPARMIYWGASQKMVQVGHLDLGDRLEIWTYKKGYTYALLQDEQPSLNGTFAALPEDDARYVPPMKGHYYDIVPFWSDQPVKSKVYMLNILDTKSLQYKVYNGELNVKREAADEEGRTLYTFSNKEDIMPLKREPRALANNDIQCKLLLSTSPDWQAKSRWFYGVNEDYGSFTATPEVQKKVNELLRGAKDEMDSISRLTHWVADNIRYAGISMGEGEGFTLHNQKMNFTDRCGVCKDKASTLIGFLRAAGFKAYAAMTMAGERIDRIPADQFNHSVCAVQLRDGSFRMLDPTWVPNVRELWSSAEQQQGYLIGTAEGCDLMETPISPAQNHYIRIIGESAIDMEGTLTGTLTITAEGQSDAAVRGVFSAPQSQWRSNLERELQHRPQRRNRRHPIQRPRPLPGPPRQHHLHLPHPPLRHRRQERHLLHPPLGTQLLPPRHGPPELQPQARDAHPALQRPLLAPGGHPRNRHPALRPLAVPLPPGGRHRRPRRLVRLRIPDGRQQTQLRRAGRLRQAHLRSQRLARFPRQRHGPNQSLRNSRHFNQIST